MREAGIPDIDLAHTKRDHQAASRKKSSVFDQIYHNYLPVTFRYAYSANYSFYHQMSSKLTKHNRIKKIGHQIHRKHYITPNNLSLDLADWWNRNNHKKDTSSRGGTTFFAKSVYDSMKCWHPLTSFLNIVVFHECKALVAYQIWLWMIKGDMWLS